MIPDEVEASELDKGARIQLKTLEKENANDVARHLVMAARLIDEDPELAHRHALSAARRGGRIAIVRESLAITAYATGDFGLALRELRTFRRISGSNDQLPLMVDSERGVGRPDRALELGRSVPRDTLPTEVRVGLAIAMSGARLDLGQAEEALAELEIPELDRTKAFSYSPMLFEAYAEVLDELGQTAAAEEWHEIARVAAEALDDEIDDVMTVVEMANPDYVEEDDDVEESDEDDTDDEMGVDAERQVVPEAADFDEGRDEQGSAVVGASGAENGEELESAPGDAAEERPVEADGQSVAEEVSTTDVLPEHDRDDRGN
jgi:hypothetical protein